METDQGLIHNFGTTMTESAAGFDQHFGLSMHCRLLVCLALIWTCVRWQTCCSTPSHACPLALYDLWNGQT